MNRVKFLQKIALAASFALALAFTFSCSSDGSGSSEATYWYSSYGIANASSCTYIASLGSEYFESLSYDDINYIWSEIRITKDFILSGNNMSEKESKDFLIQRGVSPKEVDNILINLKKRGNALIPFESRNPFYCLIIVYVERE